jgi:hypothetical protein
MIMKYEIGDVIKSMDFPSRTDCYMIGEITAIDKRTERLTLTTMEIVSEGKNRNVNKGDQFFTHYGLDIFESMYKEPRIQFLTDSSLVS